MLNYRLLPVLFIILFPIFLVATPSGHAIYRISPTVADKWPLTGSSSAIVNGLTLGDAATNGGNNIVTVGDYNNGTNFGQLRIYNKSSSSLVLAYNQLFRSPAANYFLSGVAISDIDGNAQNDVIYIANAGASGNPPIASQIGVYRYTPPSLIKERQHNFTGPGSQLETRGIAIWNYGGVHQIITIGYYRVAGPTDYAQLGIWSFDGVNVNKVYLQNWTMPGGTGSQGFGVATGDVSNNNGVPDIVTVGYANNGTATLCELRVWGWSGSGIPQPKGTRTWLTTGQGSIASSISIKDMTGNGQKQIIVGGQVLSFPFWKPELTVWSDWTGSLTQQAETNWQTSSQVNYELDRVAAGDVDGDGVTEIVTAGFINQPIGSTDVSYGTVRTWALEGSTLTLEKSWVSTTALTPIVAVTVGDVDNDGKQDIIDGGQYVGKGFVEVQDVSFVYGAISLGVIPSPSLSGQSVTVSGTLTNSTDGTPFVSSQVLLESSVNGSSYQLLATVTTDSSGRFASSYTPPGQGSYTVRATWSGDDTHMGVSTTKDFNVNKVPSVMVFSLSNFNAKPGDTVTVSGYVYPATMGTITITYTSPTGAMTTHTVTSNGSGYFMDQASVSTAGTWTVSASWPGSSSTAGATSNSLRVQVQADPLQFALATYGFGLAIAALGIGAAALVMSRKGRGTKATASAATAK